MASDGCQDMPRAQYPIHGVRHWYAYDEVGKDHGHSQRSAPPRQQTNGNTGTWNGSAPRGNPNLVAFSQAKMTDAPVRARPGPGKSTIPLPRGGVMPLMALSAEGSKDVVSAALASGYRHVDCSPEYNNQVDVGSAISSSGVAREELFISSKLACEDHGDVAGACKRTLAELGLSQLELYYVAWPVALKKGTQDVDHSCTLESTWKQMEGLVEQGLVKYIGLSNFDLPQVEKILACCTIKPAVLSVELHPLHAQRKLLGVCKRYGLAAVAHHPLGDGKIVDTPAAVEAAKECGMSPLLTVLRWNVQRQVVVAIPGTDAAQVTEAAGVITFSLVDEEKRRLDAINADQRCVVPPFMSFADPEEGGCTKPSVVLGY